MSIPKTQKVILIEETGDLDVLKYTDSPVPEISDNEILIKNKYSGINYIENYFRTGVYAAPKPYILGREASGTVAAVGANVKDYRVGDKVAYPATATFAQYTKVNATHPIIKLDSDISEENFKKLGSILIQGLTAITFASEVYDVQKGDFILVYAAAGGVGQVLLQIIKQRGAHAIAVASSEEKLQLAKSLGAEYLINNQTDDIVAKVKEFTNGKGVQAAYDSVGKDTYDTTLQSLGLNGRFVSFGNASGPIGPVTINTWPNNIQVSRPTVLRYIATPDLFAKYSKILVDSLVSGDLKYNVSKPYPLSEYKEANKLLISRKTTGKLTLEIPQWVLLAWPWIIRYRFMLYCCVYFVIMEC